MVESGGRTWSLITLSDERQYRGNVGYEDDPTRLYRYDSVVLIGD
jgi:hypothetical protein